MMTVRQVPPKSSCGKAWSIDVVLVGIKLISGLKSAFGCHKLDYVAWFDGFESHLRVVLSIPSLVRRRTHAHRFFSDEVAIVDGFGFPHRLLLLARRKDLYLQ